MTQRVHERTGKTITLDVTAATSVDAVKVSPPRLKRSTFGMMNERMIPRMTQRTWLPSSATMVPQQLNRRMTAAHFTRPLSAARQWTASNSSGFRLPMQERIQAMEGCPAEQQRLIYAASSSRTGIPWLGTISGGSTRFTWCSGCITTALHHN
jgi:hypothetical protein